MHPLNESAEFAVREFFGGAYRFLNPAINGELLLMSEFEDFKPLVFRGLFVGGDANIAVNHMRRQSLPARSSSARFSLPLLFAADIHAVMMHDNVQ
jgi:hypothetical protein